MGAAEKIAPQKSNARKSSAGVSPAYLKINRATEPSRRPFPAPLPRLRFAHRSRHPRLARFVLHVLELLLGIVQGLLLVGDLLLVLRVLLVPVAGVAQSVARVGVHGGGTNLIFALQHVEFARQQINLRLLRRNLVGPLLYCRLLRPLAARSLGGTRRRSLLSARSGGLGPRLSLGSSCAFDRTRGCARSWSRTLRLGLLGVVAGGSRLLAYD